MATLAEIRAKLIASATQSSGGDRTGDNAVYPHWNIAEGQTATVRFIADADPANTFFWIERSLIKLPFAGVKGEANSKPVTVQVPCMEMWNETCPVLTEVRPWFKDKSLEDMGRKYWKKKSYLFQGFVVDSSYKEDGTPPANPIRRFIIGSQIFNIIKAALMDPDMEEMPTDSVRGVDFRITKSSKGGYADYNTSNWARRERALGDEELAAIKQHGPFDLKSFLPKKPGEVELKVIKEMFEASVDGEPFDMEKWGQYYKPSGYNAPAGGASKPAAPKAVPAPVPEAPADQPWDEDVAGAEKSFAAEPAVEAAPSAASSRAQDILAAIRNRNK